VHGDILIHTSMYCHVCSMLKWRLPTKVCICVDRYIGLLCLTPLNNISVIWGRSFFIGGRNRRKPPTCRKLLTNCITKSCIEYTSPWTGFELIILIVIDTDCTGTCSCKFNYHMIARYILEALLWMFNVENVINIS
jgi:hypothetical protein